MPRGLSRALRTLMAAVLGVACYLVIAWVVASVAIFIQMYALQGDFSWYAAALFGGAGGSVAGVLAAVAINDWLLRIYPRSGVTTFIVGIATLGGVAELYLSDPTFARQLYIGAHLFGAWIAAFEVLVMRRFSN